MFCKKLLFSPTCSLPIRAGTTTLPKAFQSLLHPIHIAFENVMRLEDPMAGGKGKPPPTRDAKTNGGPRDGPNDVPVGMVLRTADDGGLIVTDTVLHVNGDAAGGPETTSHETSRTNTLHTHNPASRTSARHTLSALAAANTGLPGGKAVCPCGGVCCEDIRAEENVEDKEIVDLIKRERGDHSQVSLAKFDHVPGSKMCVGLYEHFALPDGRQVHFYCHEQQAAEVPVLAAPPPSDPTETFTSPPPAPALPEPRQDQPPALPPRMYPEAPPITVNISTDGSFVNTRAKVSVSL